MRQPHELAERLEHTILGPDLLPPDAHRIATEAMHRGLAGVVVAPVWVQRVATMLRGSGVSLCAAVGFPHGTNKSTVKAIEATSCIKDGADEIVVVPHLANLMREDADAAKFELLEIARAARTTRPQVLLHAWIEVSSVRDPEALELACRIVRESAFDGIVAGRAAAPDEAPPVDVIRVLRARAEGLTMKSAGGVDAGAVERLLEAGADRVWTQRATELLSGAAASDVS
jgi:deoxyribose-phosphate aldolase